MTFSVPDFDDLPPVEGLPQGCAWGVFDREGEKDVHGTLNFLTPDVVKAAASEVRDGVSISLNWPLNGFAQVKWPIPGRKAPKHSYLSLGDTKKEAGLEIVHAWDDEIDLNTQSSSQWDSLCHYPHQSSCLSYNGAKPSRDTLNPEIETTAENQLPTLDHWHSRGCLVGRGVLLDYKAYAEAVGKEFGPFAGTRITVEELEACAVHQGVEFRQGDILVVRTGQTQFIDETTPDEFLKTLSAGRLSGVHGAVETARWLWNKRFAAVTSDAMAFEAFPPLKPDGTEGTTADLVLHPYLLSCFGMPIGEIWDLKRLSEYCGKTKRYSFMITSAPLNLPGLIGSPPNALAIF